MNRIETDRFIVTFLLEESTKKILNFNVACYSDQAIFIHKSMKWRVVLEPDPESNEWAIRCPELPRCNSAGISEEEALKNIQEAIELYLQPDPLKLPPDTLIREVIFGSYDPTREVEVSLTS